MIITHRIAVVVLGLIAGSCSQVPHAKPSGPATPFTVSLQDGPVVPCNHPTISGYYEITVVAFKNGAPNVDPTVYEQDSFTFFRSVAASTGANPEQLVEHVRRIPKQIIQIVKDDPKVLDNCHNFGLALFGPH